MFLTKPVKEILSTYNFLNPGVRSNLVRILMHGRLSGTGKLIILPVDQGFEHGPETSFAMNPDAYSPYYHAEFAIKNGMSAAAFPLGIIQSIAGDFAGILPLILKINHGDSLYSDEGSPSQSIIASVYDAVKLGCVGIGYTIYPGSPNYKKMLNDFSIIREKAEELGLVVVVWAYPRGGHIAKEHQSSADIISYSAHMAALAGAHIIKVKIPTSSICNKKLTEVYKNYCDQSTDSIAGIVSAVKRSCLNRLVVFSGGAGKATDKIIDEISSIIDGGGDGSIIGRNAFQRNFEDASVLINSIINKYLLCGKL